MSTNTSQPIYPLPATSLHSSSASVSSIPILLIKVTMLSSIMPEIQLKRHALFLDSSEWCHVTTVTSVTRLLFQRLGFVYECLSDVHAPIYQSCLDIQSTCFKSLYVPRCTRRHLAKFCAWCTLCQATSHELLKRNGPRVILGRMPLMPHRTISL